MFALVGLSCLMLLNSCVKVEIGDDTPAQTQVYRDFYNLPSDTTQIGTFAMGQPIYSGKFTFFSLDSNKIIASSDSNTNKWDLAFSGSTVRVNSGTSGPGNSAGFLQIGLFDTTRNVPKDSTFYTDNGTTLAFSKYKRWYTYDGINMILKPTPGTYFIIKTNQNSYCKLQIISYYKDQIDVKNAAAFANYTTQQKLQAQRLISFQTQCTRNGGTYWAPGN